MIKKSYCKAFSLVEISVTILIFSFLLAIVQYGVGFYQQSQIVKARAHSKNAPMNHMSNLVIWYETSLEDNFKEQNIADSQDIEIWYNRAPNYWHQNNATQSNIANRPIYKEKILNDMIPALYYDGSDDFLNFDANLLINSDFSFIVVETRLRGDNHDYYIGGLGGANQNFCMGYSTPTTARFGIYGSSTLDYAISNYSTPIARINSFTFSKKSGSKFWINGGVQPKGSNSITNYLSSYQGARIGDTENAYFYQGYIAEMIVFNKALNDQERQDIEKYLSNKFNVKLD